MTAGAPWKSTGWYIEPVSVRKIMTTLAAIGAHSSGQRFAWRGMSSIDYDLSSSLQRTLRKDQTEQVDEPAMRRAEQQIIRRAREWGLGAQPVGALDDLQLLTDLQHYNVPTRLIDVTSNPTTALWFACQAPQDAAETQNGVLLAINVTGWPLRQSIDVMGLMTWGALGDPTGWRLKTALETGYPFRVESVMPNDRLRAQEGYFLAGALPAGRPGETSPITGLPIQYKTGDAKRLERDLLEERPRGAPRIVPFVAVGIRQRLKEPLLRILEGTYNRRARVLFPDVDGFERHDPYRQHLDDPVPAEDADDEAASE